MLFKRREKPELRERAQAWLWPRRGWKRAMHYVRHRVIRLSGSPHVIALGFAAGAFTSFTPFLGLHFLVAAILALVIGGNVLASALGTFVGNPLTFPFIWFSTYSFGSFLLGVDVQGADRPDMPKMSLWANMSDVSGLVSEFWTKLWPLVKPMTVGGVPLGILIGAISYFIVKMIVTTYQANRRARLKRREEERRGARSRAEV